ncbi:hypothetical protein D3C87_1914180 [compost metagenome]
MGKPRARVRSVVKKDSLIERQIIERCASARPRVSSNMSRWKSTENQPSIENCPNLTSP